jgi:hypothetical protein
LPAQTSWLNERPIQKYRECRDLGHSLNAWDALLRFLDDGRLCMTNNAAERALRCIAVGRNNWTFAGSDAGGRRAAAIYTLIETAKLNDVDPQAWLTDVLARLHDHPARRITDLLPWELETAATAAATSSRLNPSQSRLTPSTADSAASAGRVRSGSCGSRADGRDRDRFLGRRGPGGRLYAFRELCRVAEVLARLRSPARRAGSGQRRVRPREESLFAVLVDFDLVVVGEPAALTALELAARNRYLPIEVARRQAKLR